MHPLGWQYEQYQDVREVLDQGAARMASAQEYADWLEGHLWNRWGSIDFDFRDGKASAQGIYTVLKDIDLPEFRGAQGLKLIVPQGVKVNFAGDIGDNEVFFAEDYTAKMSANHKLAIYSDVLDALDPRGYSAESFIYATAKKDFNRAVIRSATERAFENILGGLTQDAKVRPLQLIKPPAR